MDFDFVVFLFSIIQAAFALSQPAKKWIVLQAFVPNGLYGRELAIRRGTKILCDIPATSSPRNTTCKDNQSVVFLQSNNSLTVITEATNATCYLECDGEMPLQYNGSFDSQEEALISFYPVVTQNLSNPIPRAAEDLPDSDQNLYWLLILILILVPVAIYLIFWVKKRSKRGEYYCRKTDQDPNDGQWESLNSEDTTQPTSKTQNGTNGTLSNGVLPGPDLSVDSMDSDFQASNV